MKRFFDIITSLILIVCLSPVLLLLSLLVLIFDGTPVIFSQQRVGRGNRLFRIYKFRTMKRGTRNASTTELTDSDDCITPLGRILRKTSLDELPQLFNVLNGTMSFVGPRPLIPEEDDVRQLREKYNVFSVRPGITGLAQINGRDRLSAEKKALFDKEYVEKQSILFDIKICFMTVGVVLRRKDILEGGQKK